MSSSKSMKAAHTAALSQQKTPPSQKARAVATAADKPRRVTKPAFQAASKQLDAHPVKDWSEAGDLPEPSESDIELVIAQQLLLLKQGVAQELTEDLIITKHALDDSQTSSIHARSQFLSQLTHIRLDRQGLTSLGGQVLRQLHNVTHIYLQHNQLTSLEGLSHLPCLRFAAVSHNKLHNVEDIANLAGLLFLDVSHNCIEQLDVRQLPTCIRFLKIEGNPCVAQPAAQSAAQQAILQHIPDLRDLDGPLIESDSDSEDENDDALDQEQSSQHASTVTCPVKEATPSQTSTLSNPSQVLGSEVSPADSRQLAEALQQLDAAETHNLRIVEKSQQQRHQAQTVQHDSQLSSRPGTASSVRLLSSSESARVSQVLPTVKPLLNGAAQMSVGSPQLERSRNSIGDRISNNFLPKQLSMNERSNSIGLRTASGMQSFNADTTVGCDSHKEVDMEKQIDADLDELRQQLQWLSEPLTATAQQAESACANEQHEIRDTNTGPGKARVVSARSGAKEGTKQTTRPSSGRAAFVTHSVVPNPVSMVPPGQGSDAAPGQLHSTHAACQALHSEVDRMLGAAAERLSEQRRTDSAATTDIRNLRSSVSMASALKSGLNLKTQAADMPGAISAVRDAVGMRDASSLQTAGELAKDALEQYAQRTILHPGSRPASSHDPLRASLARLKQYSSHLADSQGSNASQDSSLPGGQQGIPVVQQLGIPEGNVRSKYYQAIARATAAKSTSGGVDEDDTGDSGDDSSVLV